MKRLATVDEILSAILRHIVLLAMVIALGVAASLFYALSLPRSFETTAIIQIEQPQVQQSMGAGDTVNARTLQQLQIIEQRVMSRDNLLVIIDKLDLYSEFPEMSDNEKVVALREAAGVSRVSDPALAWRPDIIPTALNIVVRLGDPELAAQVANELVSNVLEQNKSRRAGRAQETLDFFVSEESRIGATIEKLEITVADFKRDNAEFLTAGLNGQREQLLLLQQEKLELEREFVELNTGLRGARNAAFENRVAQLNQQSELLDRRIDVIEALVRQAPEVERELSGLERQLQKLTDQYQIITRNQAEAEMSLMLQASQQGESFRVLERAVVPEKPVAPNRKRIAFLGCILSAIAGLLVVGFLEMRNPIIRTEHQLERHLGLRAVAVIPNVQVARERAWRRAFWIVGIIVFVVACVMVLAVVSAR
ncbi:hypothetical protein NBRC116601_03590 [Cognatishimia sp. WU-CL00825]|uniref:GumC family protein n=1 Tax=Cognatishimia sp. WU-CL00825 TaxID=3127658 RepID=UPI003104F836